MQGAGQKIAMAATLSTQQEEPHAASPVLEEAPTVWEPWPSSKYTLPPGNCSRPPPTLGTTWVLDPSGRAAGLLCQAGSWRTAPSLDTREMTPVSYTHLTLPTNREV